MIINNIYDIDFSKLKQNQQLIELNNNDYNSKDYKSYFFYQNISNFVYRFNVIDLNINGNLYKDMHNNYLSIVDDIVQLNNEYLDIVLIDEYKLNVRISDNVDTKVKKAVVNLCNNVKEDFFDNIYYENKDNINKIVYMCVLKINNIKLVIRITHTLNPKILYWNKSYNIYHITDDDAVIRIKFENVDQFINILRYKFEDKTNRLLNQHLINTNKLKHFIENNNKINIIKSEFKDSEFIDIIDKYFEPIFEENGMKAYFEDFYTFTCPDVFTVNCYSHAFERKAKSVMRSIINYSDIDIYTGECIKIGYNIKYKDNQYIVIGEEDEHMIRDKISKFNNFHIYEKIDNIFVEVEDNKKDVIDEINTRLQLLSKLSE